MRIVELAGVGDEFLRLGGDFWVPNPAHHLNNYAGWQTEHEEQERNSTQWDSIEWEWRRFSMIEIRIDHSNEESFSPQKSGDC